jgi:hypothetical protein
MSESAYELIFCTKSNHPNQEAPVLAIKLIIVVARA